MLFYITEDYNNDNILQEISREDRNRLKFKKKYNFEPSKENKDIGFITDPKTGKKYKVDMKKSNYDIGISGLKERVMCAKTGRKDSDIILDKNFFLLKNGKRRKATLDHEIGHQNLHNTNLSNKTVDDRNKSGYVYSRVAAHPNINKIIKLDSQNPDNLGKRMDAFKKAEKYNGDENHPHERAQEYEADRYSANRNEERELKRTLRNERKLALSKNGIKRHFKAKNTINKVNAINNGKEIPNSIQLTKNRIKKYKKARNNEFTSDYLHRIKALKDKDLQNSDIYKD